MAIRLGVVFDGVIHRAGGRLRPGDEVPGARAFLGQAVTEFEVLVMSPCFDSAAGMRQALDWCRRTFGDIALELRFRPGFPEVDVLLSAESIPFAGKYPGIEQIRRLRRWAP